MFTWLKQGTRVHLCGDVWFTKTLCTFVRVILWEWFRDGIRLCALVLACVCVSEYVCEGLSEWGIMRECLCEWVTVCKTICLQEGNPPPKNMLNRSSGVMSPSKPLWKSKPPGWAWPGLLGSSPPVRSYCLLLSALLSTEYALPISGGKQQQHVLMWIRGPTHI